MEAIGIDWKILLVQVINFLLLFLILRWVLYKPILNILDERKKKIEESTSLAEKTKKEAEELEIKNREIMEIAKKDALAILDESKSQGQKNRKEILEQASHEAEVLMKKAEERILKQREEMVRDLRKETVNLTIATTEKLLGKNIDNETQKKLIMENLEKIEKE